MLVTVIYFVIKYTTNQYYEGGILDSTKKINGISGLEGMDEL